MNQDYLKRFAKFADMGESELAMGVIGEIKNRVPMNEALPMLKEIADMLVDCPEIHPRGDWSAAYAVAAGIYLLVGDMALYREAKVQQALFWDGCDDRVTAIAILMEAGFIVEAQKMATDYMNRARHASFSGLAETTGTLYKKYLSKDALTAELV